MGGGQKDHHRKSGSVEAQILKLKPRVTKSTAQVFAANYDFCVKIAGKVRAGLDRTRCYSEQDKAHQYGTKGTEMFAPVGEASHCEIYRCHTETLTHLERDVKSLLNVTYPDTSVHVPEGSLSHDCEDLEFVCRMSALAVDQTDTRDCGFTLVCKHLENNSIYHDCKGTVMSATQIVAGMTFCYSWRTMLKYPQFNAEVLTLVQILRDSNRLVETNTIAVLRHRLQNKEVFSSIPKRLAELLIPKPEFGLVEGKARRKNRWEAYDPDSYEPLSDKLDGLCEEEDDYLMMMSKINGSQEAVRPLVTPVERYHDDSDENRMRAKSEVKPIRGVRVVFPEKQPERSMNPPPLPPHCGNLSGGTRYKASTLPTIPRPDKPLVETSRLLRRSFRKPPEPPRVQADPEVRKCKPVARVAHRWSSPDAMECIRKFENGSHPARCMRPYCLSKFTETHCKNLTAKIRAIQAVNTEAGIEMVLDGESVREITNLTIERTAYEIGSLSIIPLSNLARKLNVQLNSQVVLRGASGAENFVPLLRSEVLAKPQNNTASFVPKPRNAMSDLAGAAPKWRPEVPFRIPDIDQMVTAFERSKLDLHKRVGEQNNGSNARGRRLEFSDPDLPERVGDQHQESFVRHRQIDERNRKLIEARRRLHPVPNVRIKKAKAPPPPPRKARVLAWSPNSLTGMFMLGLLLLSMLSTVDAERKIYKYDSVMLESMGEARLNAPSVPVGRESDPGLALKNEDDTFSALIEVTNITCSTIRNVISVGLYGKSEFVVPVDMMQRKPQKKAHDLCQSFEKTELPVITCLADKERLIEKMREQSLTRIWSSITYIPSHYVHLHSKQTFLTRSLIGSKDKGKIAQVGLTTPLQTCDFMQSVVWETYPPTWTIGKNFKGGLGLFYSLVKTDKGDEIEVCAAPTGANEGFPVMEIEHICDRRRRTSHSTEQLVEKERACKHKLTTLIHAQNKTRESTATLFQFLENNLDKSSGGHATWANNPYRMTPAQNAQRKFEKFLVYSNVGPKKTAADNAHHLNAKQQESIELEIERSMNHARTGKDTRIRGKRDASLDEEDPLESNDAKNDDTWFRSRKLMLIRAALDESPASSSSFSPAFDGDDVVNTMAARLKAEQASDSTDDTDRIRRSSEPMVVAYTLQQLEQLMAAARKYLAAAVKLDEDSVNDDDEIMDLLGMSKGMLEEMIHVVKQQQHADAMADMFDHLANPVMDFFLTPVRAIKYLIDEAVGTKHAGTAREVILMPSLIRERNAAVRNRFSNSSKGFNPVMQIWKQLKKFGIKPDDSQMLILLPVTEYSDVDMAVELFMKNRTIHTMMTHIDPKLHDSEILERRKRNIAPLAALAALTSYINPSIKHAERIMTETMTIMKRVNGSYAPEHFPWISKATDENAVKVNGWDSTKSWGNAQDLELSGWFDDPVGEDDDVPRELRDLMRAELEEHREKRKAQVAEIMGHIHRLALLNLQFYERLALIRTEARRGAPPPPMTVTVLQNHSYARMSEDELIAHMHEYINSPTDTSTRTKRQVTAVDDVKLAGAVINQLSILVDGLRKVFSALVNPPGMRAARRKRDIFTTGIVKEISENTPFRFLGSIASMVLGLEMSGDNQQNIGYIQDNRVVIKDLSFNQHVIMTNAINTRDNLGDIVVQMERLDEDVRLQIITQNIDNILSHVDDNVQTLTSNIFRIINAIQSTYTASRTGSTSTFAITAGEIKETVDTVYKMHKIKVAFNYDTRSEVKYLGNGKIRVMFYPEADETLYTLYKLKAIPIFKDGYRYTADLEHKFAAVSKETKHYYGLTETEFEKCHHHKRCHTEQPARLTQNSICGIGAIVAKTIDCRYNYDRNMEPYFATLGNGTVFSAPQDLEIITSCDPDENVQASRFRPGHSAKLPRTGYLEVEQHCRATIKPYDIEIANRLSLTTDMKFHSDMTELTFIVENQNINLTNPTEIGQPIIADLVPLHEIHTLAVINEDVEDIKRSALMWVMPVAISALASVIFMIYCHTRCSLRGHDRAVKEDVKVTLNTFRDEQSKTPLSEWQADDIYKEAMQRFIRHQEKAQFGNTKFVAPLNAFDASFSGSRNVSSPATHRLELTHQQETKSYEAPQLKKVPERRSTDERLQRVRRMEEEDQIRVEQDRYDTARHIQKNVEAASTGAPPPPYADIPSAPSASKPISKGFVKKQNVANDMELRTAAIPAKRFAHVNVSVHEPPAKEIKGVLSNY